MVLQFLGGAGEKIGVGLTMVRSGTYSSHFRSPTRRLFLPPSARNQLVRLAEMRNASPLVSLWATRPAAVEIGGRSGDPQ